MAALMRALAGSRRQEALGNYVAAAEAIALVEFPDRSYGQILGDAPIVADRWHDYLRLGLDQFIASNGAAIASAIGDVDGLRAKALALLGPVPRHPAKALVHGDYFPGNLLLDERLQVSGLVDFSVWTLVGDRAIDLIGAALFLEMLDQATAEDVATARRLVLARHSPAILPLWRFYRAYCAFALARPTDAGGLYPKMVPWSLANLRALAAGTLDF
jgi:hypothetical protein